MLEQTQAPKRGRRKLRALVWLTSVTFLVLCLLILFRDSIVKNTVNHYFSDQNVKLTCLDSQLRWKFALNIRELCLSTPTLNLQIQNADWDRSENKVLIEQVLFEHIVSKEQTSGPSKSSEEISISELNQLSQGLPLLIIDEITLSSPLLAKPLELKAELSPDGKLQVDGDIQADLQIQNGKVSAKLDWQLGDIQFIPAVKTIFEQHSDVVTQELLENNITSDFSFDGLTIEGQHQISLNHSLSIADCALDLGLDGSAGIAVSNLATSFDIALDLSDLLMQTKSSECEVIPKQLSNWQLKAFTLRVPREITLVEQKLHVPSLILEQVKANLQDQQELKLTFDELVLDLSKGNADANYHLLLHQAFPSSLLESNFSEGEIKLESEGKASLTDSQSVQVQGKLSQVKINRGTLKLDEANANFNASLSPELALVSKVDIEAKSVQLNQIKIAQMTSTLNVDGPSLNALALSMQHSSNSIVSPQGQLKNLTGELTGTLSNLDKLTLKGHTFITPNFVQFESYKLTLDMLRITHDVTSKLSLANTVSEHELSLGENFTAKASQHGSDILLLIEEQKLTELNALLRQILPELALSEGSINANVNAHLNESSAAIGVDGQLSLQGLNGSYMNTLFSGLNVRSPFKIDAEGFTLKNSPITIQLINAGIPVENIRANLLSEQGSIKLEELDGSLLGGKFSLRNMWLDSRQQTFDLVLQDIDLEKIVALQEQPGIQVRGKLMGKVPFIKTDSSIAVDEGKMTSQDGGKLTIKNNPAFDTIKEQQPELAYLEDYQFSQLSSKVSFQPDGMLILDMSFTGKNEEKKQAVNFNYNHQENIFDLLKAKRITNGIQDKIERNITQGAKR